MEEFNIIKNIGNKLKKVGSDIKKKTESIASDISKNVKKVDWKKIGKIAYEGANMVVPIKTFEKISKGQKLDAWDIIDLATMVPIPGIGAAMKVGSIAAKTTAKIIVKEVGKKVSKHVAKKIVKGTAKKEFNKTEIGKNINNKIKDVSTNVSSSISQNVSPKSNISSSSNVSSSQSLQSNNVGSFKFYLPKSNFSSSPTVSPKSNVSSSQSSLFNSISRKNKFYSIEKKELDKIIEKTNKTNIKNISENIDDIIKKDKTLNEDILEILKNNMKKLNLKLPSEERLKEIISVTAIATPIVIKSREIQKYNEEINREIKKENIRVTDKPLIESDQFNMADNIALKILLLLLMLYICYEFKKLNKKIL